MKEGSETQHDLLTGKQAAAVLYQRFQKQIVIPRPPNSYATYTVEEATDLWWRCLPGSSGMPNNAVTLKQSLKNYDIRLELSTLPKREYQAFIQKLGQLALEQQAKKIAEEDRLFNKRQGPLR